MLIYINLLQRELHRGWGSFLKKCTNISSSVQGWDHLQHELFFLSFPPLGRPWPIRILAVGRSSTSFCAFLELKTRSVIARNISSTLIFSFADVSNSWMPIWVAKRPASSRKTTLRSGSSHLLPTKTRATSSQFWLISCNHLQKYQVY